MNTNRSTSISTLSLAAVIAVLPCAAVAAQEPEDVAEPRGVAAVVVHSRGQLRAHVLNEQIEVRTPYGILTLPISEVRHVQLTPRPAAPLLAELEQALISLGSDDEDAVDRAQGWFDEHRTPFVLARLRAAAAELGQPALAARAAELFAALGVGAAQVLPDRIIAEAFTVRGTVLTPALRLSYPDDQEQGEMPMERVLALSLGDMEPSRVSAPFFGQGERSDLWSMTYEADSPLWMQPEYDDSGWKALPLDHYKKLDDGLRGERTRLLRADFELAELPARALFELAGAASYSIWINGMLLRRVESVDNSAAPEGIALDGQLRIGANTIAIETAADGQLGVTLRLDD